MGPESIWRWHLTNKGNTIVEIRWSYDRLISTMGFPILVRRHLYWFRAIVSTLKQAWESWRFLEVSVILAPSVCDTQAWWGHREINKEFNRDPKNIQHSGTGWTRSHDGPTPPPQNHHSGWKPFHLLKMALEKVVLFQGIKNHNDDSRWTLNPNYHQTSDIRHTKPQKLNVSHLVLQLSFPNPLKPGVKSGMKM